MYHQLKKQAQKGKGEKLNPFNLISSAKLLVFSSDFSEIVNKYLKDKGITRDQLSEDELLQLYQSYISK